MIARAGKRVRGVVMDGNMFGVDGDFMTSNKSRQDTLSQRQCSSKEMYVCYIATVSPSAHCTRRDYHLRPRTIVVAAYPATSIDVNF
jgi:hypothetical protein